jgi:hypothetical protein
MKTYGVVVCYEFVVEAPNPEIAEVIALIRADSQVAGAASLKADVECEYTEDGKVLAV